MGRECNKDECSNPVFAKHYCKWHQYLREDKKLKQLKKSPIKKVYKTTGELELFKEIWGERVHRCYVSGEPLKEFRIDLFAHVLPKGGYPGWRLKKKNIVLLAPPNHYLYDHCKDQAKKLPMFEKLFKLREDFKVEYYQEQKIQKF